MTKLGESPIALTEDVVKKKPLVVSPTFMEWVADGNVEQITQARSNTLADTLYIVPDNFTLFITSAFVSASCTTGAPSNRSAILTIDGDEEGKAILFASITGGYTSANNAISFPMPFKVNSGQIVRGILNVNTLGRWGFIGFLLPKKISIR